MKKIIKIVKKSAIGFMILAFAVGSFGFLPDQPAYALAPPIVDLGTAGNYVILAKTGISTTGSTNVVGDIGVSPNAATSITGFALSLTAGSPFSTSALVTGKIYAPGYASPTPANLTTAIGDMETAYTTANGLAPGTTELGAGNIGSLTIVPGVYKWTTGVTIPTDVTLSGGANDSWVFQIAQNLNLSSGTKILLSGGAKAENIFWIVGGQTTIGTTAVFNGNILDKTAIVLNTGATLNGRALAQTAVVLDSNYVSNDFPGSTTDGTIPGNVGGGSEVGGPLGNGTISGNVGGGSEVGGPLGNGTIPGNVGGGSEVGGPLGNGTTIGGGSEVGGPLGNGTISGNVQGGSTSSGGGGGGGGTVTSPNVGGRVLGASTTGGSNNPGQVLGASDTAGFPATGLGFKVTPGAINLVGLMVSLVILLMYAYHRTRINA